MKELLAASAVSMADSPPVRSLLKHIARNQCTIFMLHRFDLSCYGIDSSNGHDPLFLEECLMELLNNGYNVASVDEVYKAAKEGKNINNAVVFTIDDGYFDHAVVAEKVFAKHQCPVTIFLVTDFIDGNYWPIEARIKYIIEASKRDNYQFEVPGQTLSATTKKAFSSKLIEYCKTLSLENAEGIVKALSTRFEIKLPAHAPEKYRALSWEDARRLEKMGISFGAHTSQHPALSRESDASAQQQIETSITRVAQELKKPSAVFCYPTGRSCDFTARDAKLAQSAGCIGAVTSESGYFDINQYKHDDFITCKRFSFPDNLTDFKQCILYLELLKT